MTIKISIVLDYNLDIFREIKIGGTTTLEELHHVIVQAFNLDKNEMAAFYLSNNDWEQGQEIPLISMQNNVPEMKNILSKDIFQENKRVLYINNFLLMWRFMIEVTEICQNSTLNSPEITLSFGAMPAESPDIQFVANKDNSLEDNDIFDAGFDEFGEYENYEEY